MSAPCVGSEARAARGQPAGHGASRACLVPLGHRHMGASLTLPWAHRYLDPDPLLLVEEANSRTNPKFHALNQAIVQLVRCSWSRKRMLQRRTDCCPPLSPPSPSPSLLPPHSSLALLDRRLLHGLVHAARLDGRGLGRVITEPRGQCNAVRRGRGESCRACSSFPLAEPVSDRTRSPSLPSFLTALQEPKEPKDLDGGDFGDE